MKNLQEKINCLNCFKEHWVKQSVLRKGHGKFCSVSCKSRYFWAKPGFKEHQKVVHQGYLPTNLEQISAKDEKNVNWKGENILIRTLHTWVEKRLGKPETCEHCGKTGLKGHKIHWANKEHSYKRNLSDWLRLCSFCHWTYDQENGLRIKKGEYARG